MPLFQRHNRTTTTTTRRTHGRSRFPRFGRKDPDRVAGGYSEFKLAVIHHLHVPVNDALRVLLQQRPHCLTLIPQEEVGSTQNNSCGSW